ncbi:MAG TPA: aromatic ring-hydroxylating dioxygenase subunit alpha [Phycisphaerae bacterium]|nr:aromatic ring-hydroxylating dioxygenase subunit alpha [Phycisphaerae bacterium]
MTMHESVRDIVGIYDASASLARAYTIPAPWYVDPRIDAQERAAVFGRTWQYVGRVDQLAAPGSFITADVAGEPIVIVRGADNTLRAFFNVCRHHAALVACEPAGACSVLQCPYHGWTYGLDGALKGMPEFEGVENFAKSDNGLVPVRVETWENFVFVNLSDKGGRKGPHDGGSLTEYLGDAVDRIAPLGLSKLHFFERRSYALNCNWKVYVDNYLDGGYHVPHLHKSLSTVLEYKDYLIENGPRYCLQWSPMKTGKDAATAAVRKGDMAYYYWFYPNFMLNWYEGVMDTNLVLPLGIDKCLVVFDFYFDQVAGDAETRNRQSIAVAERVQQEDVDICESVQRGLTSRAYVAGRLSVRREAGEHLFHRLLHADLSAADRG